MRRFPLFLFVSLLVIPFYSFSQTTNQQDRINELEKKLEEVLLRLEECCNNMESCNEFELDQTDKVIPGSGNCVIQAWGVFDDYSVAILGNCPGAAELKAILKSGETAQIEGYGQIKLKKINLEGKSATVCLYPD